LFIIPLSNLHLHSQIILETEYDNHAALSLYERLGFIREKRLHRFYLNGKDAFRLSLSIPAEEDSDDSDNGNVGMMWPLPKVVGRLSHKQLSRRVISVSPYTDDEDDETVSGR
jgi:peptide alpha-N-acetyltransferase